MVLSAIIAVPPGLYVKSQVKIVQYDETVAPFQYLAIMLRNRSFVLLFFQWVFVSASSRIYIMLGLILINSSVR